MLLSLTFRRNLLWLVVLLVIAGCTGITPYEPRNNREEGPEKGLFTGSDGAFVILRKADEPQTGDEDGKRSEETSEGEQQTTESDEREKKAGTQSGAQQP